MQLLIHGGFHKTGTTAFQKSTFLKLHELSDGGIIYNPPDLYNILTDKWKRDVFSYSESELAKVKKFFDRCAAETVFISAECFSGNLFNGYRYEQHEKKVRALELILPADCELQFLFTVREPRSWIVSAYREAVKDHHYITFEEFIENFEFSDRNTLILSQEKLLLAVEQQGHPLTVLSYEDLKADNRIMVKAISDITCSPLELMVPERQSNKSLNWKYIDFLLRIKQSPFGFILPRPIHFKGDRSVYEIEHKLNSSFFGRWYKRIFFLYRRGRWLRYVTRGLSQYGNRWDEDYEAKAAEVRREIVGDISVQGSGWEKSGPQKD